MRHWHKRLFQLHLLCNLLPNSLKIFRTALVSGDIVNVTNQPCQAIIFFFRYMLSRERY